MLRYTTDSWNAYGLFLLQTIIALALIGVAAWMVVHYLKPRGANRLQKTTRIRVLERKIIEPKRALYLVEVDGRTLLIGSSDGSLRLITHWDSDGSFKRPGESE